MSEVDESAKWAIDLLSPDPLYEENLLSKYFHYITLPALGVGAVITMNWMTYKAPLAGIHKHGAGLLVGIAAAYITKTSKTNRESTRDAALRQYIRQHPEDFIQSERKTYNDVFDVWVPCR